MSSPPQPQVTDPVAFVRQYGSAWLAEVAGLREVPIPEHGADAGAFHAALLTAQGHLDRLEAVLRLAVALKGGTGRRATEEEHNADTAWAQQADADRRSGRGQGEYESGKERAARLDLRILDQRRKARQWRQAASLAAEFEQQVRDAFFGIQGARTVLLASLRYLSTPLPGNME